MADTSKREELIERPWTQDHYVTRNSISEDDTYRVWMTCRCGWNSGDLPDGNLPTTHQAELEHYVAVFEQAHTPTDDERMVIYANSNVTRGKFAAAAVHAALTAVGAHHGGPVIVLGAKPSEIAQRATVIRDAGKTEVEPGTITAGTDFARRTVQGEPTDAQVLAARTGE